jgi:hypothetical protein
MNYIHQLVFCPEQARPRYRKASLFSERSIKQLRGKLRRDHQEISEHVERK